MYMSANFKFGRFLLFLSGVSSSVGSKYGSKFKVSILLKYRCFSSEGRWAIFVCNIINFHWGDPRRGCVLKMEATTKKSHDWNPWIGIESHCWWNQLFWDSYQWATRLQQLQNCFAQCACAPPGKRATTFRSWFWESQISWTFMEWYCLRYGNGSGDGALGHVYT